MLICSPPVSLFVPLGYRVSNRAEHPSRACLIPFRFRDEFHRLIQFRQRQLDADLAERQHGVRSLVDSRTKPFAVRRNTTVAAVSCSTRT